MGEEAVPHLPCSKATAREPWEESQTKVAKAKAVGLGNDGALQGAALSGPACGEGEGWVR
jgi:hypothetical protein